MSPREESPPEPFGLVRESGRSSHAVRGSRNPLKSFPKWRNLQRLVAARTRIPRPASMPGSHLRQFSLHRRSANAAGREWPGTPRPPSEAFGRAKADTATAERAMGGPACRRCTARRPRATTRPGRHGRCPRSTGPSSTADGGQRVGACGMLRVGRRPNISADNLTSRNP